MKPVTYCCLALLLFSVASAQASVLNDKGEQNESYIAAARRVEQENWTVAAALLQAARKECPESIAVLSLSGYVARRQGRSEEAVADCCRVLEIAAGQRRLVRMLSKAVSGEKKEALARRKRHIARVLEVLKEKAPAVEAIYRHARRLEQEAEALDPQQGRALREVAKELYDLALGTGAAEELALAGASATEAGSTRKPVPSAGRGRRVRLISPDIPPAKWRTYSRIGYKWQKVPASHREKDGAVLLRKEPRTIGPNRLVVIPYRLTGSFLCGGRARVKSGQLIIFFLKEGFEGERGSWLAYHIPLDVEGAFSWTLKRDANGLVFTMDGKPVDPHVLYGGSGSDNGYLAFWISEGTEVMLDITKFKVVVER